MSPGASARRARAGRPPACCRRSRSASTRRWSADLSWAEACPDSSRGSLSPQRERWRLYMLLDGKNAVIYGAGGSVGAAVACAFAREGAHVFLTGRTRAAVDEVAEAIRRAGGTAEVAIVDA